MCLAAVDLLGALKAMTIPMLIWILAEVLGSVYIPKPPATIRVAVYLEQGFGVALFLPTLIHMFFWPTKDWVFHPLILTSICLLGLIWTILATYVLKDSSAARQTLVVFCIFRALTIVGALPSAISIYLLDISKQAKAFFKDNQKRKIAEDENESSEM